MEMSILFIKRFSLGIAIGLFITAIFWSYSIYFQVSVSLIQGIVGSLVMTVSCGAVAVIGNLDQLMDNLPWL